MDLYYPGRAPRRAARAADAAGRPPRGVVQILLLVLVACFWRFPAAGQAAGATTQLQEAVRWEQMGRLPEAIASYRAVLQKNPSNEPAVLGLSSAYRKVFNYDEARRVLEQYAKAHPGRAAVLVDLAETDMQLDQYEAASERLRQALARDRGNARAHLDLGICYQSKNQNDAALREFNSAIAFDPKSAAAWYYRASIYADRNELARAEQDGRESLALDSASPATRVLLGKVWLRSGKCSEAADVLRPIASPDSSNTDGLFQAARAYECLKESEKAGAARERFEELSNRAQTARTAEEEAKHLSEQAEEAARKNQLAPAMDLLQQALTKDAQSGSAHALLAKIYFSEGDLGKARTEAESALRANPYHPDYLYVLGRVLEKQGDAEGALQAFERVVLVNPRESDAYYEMAQIHLRRGERQQALEALREAVRLSPDDADYRRALATLADKNKPQ